MTLQEWAIQLLPVIKAMAEGKQVMYKSNISTSAEWLILNKPVVDGNNYDYKADIEVIKVNGFEVPKPVSKKLPDHTPYWYVDINDRELVNRAHWVGIADDLRYLERRLIHLDKESAVLHAKAMLGITE